MGIDLVRILVVGGGERLHVRVGLGLVAGLVGVGGGRHIWCVALSTAELLNAMAIAHSLIIVARSFPPALFACWATNGTLNVSDTCGPSLSRFLYYHYLFTLQESRCHTTTLKLRELQAGLPFPCCLLRVFCSTFPRLHNWLCDVTDWLTEYAWSTTTTALTSAQTNIDISVCRLSFFHEVEFVRSTIGLPKHCSR